MPVPSLWDSLSPVPGEYTSDNRLAPTAYTTVYLTFTIKLVPICSFIEVILILHILYQVLWIALWYYCVRHPTICYAFPSQKRTEKHKMIRRERTACPRKSTKTAWWMIVVFVISTKCPLSMALLFGMFVTRQCAQHELQRWALINVLRTNTTTGNRCKRWKETYVHEAFVASFCT